MATSGVTNWVLTARDIVTAALQENAVIPLGREPKAKELDACLVRLNGLLKSLPAGLMHETTGEITVPANSASGALAGGIETILGLRLVVSATSERQLVRLPRDRYLGLPNKAQSGEPLMFYEAQAADGVTVHVWPVPTAERTLKVDYIRKPETITDASQTVDFPQRWQEALYSMLAVRCAGLFGTPPSIELTTRAERLEREMKDADRPDSYFMEAAGCPRSGW